MFDLIFEEKKEFFPELRFLRVWRLATRKIRATQEDKNKGVIFNVITPDAFTLKPSHRSVSLNKLLIETEDENNDSDKNRSVMQCKITNSMDESMASIFIHRDDLTQEKIAEDPEYQELISFFKIEKTESGEFTHNNIDACHYDLIYLSKEGTEMLVGHADFKKDYIINTKRMISEIAKIPQSSLI